jgi:hypothetical protein
MRLAILTLDDPAPVAPKTPSSKAFLYCIWKGREIEDKHGHRGPIIHEYVTHEEAMAEARYLQELYVEEMIVSVVLVRDHDAWDRVVNPTTEFED